MSTNRPTFEELIANLTSGKVKDIEHTNIYACRVATYQRGAAKVTKSTRAPEDGRVITCPNCNTDSTVFNFGWSALHCTTCDQYVEKTDWLVK